MTTIKRVYKKPIETSKLIEVAKRFKVINEEIWNIQKEIAIDSSYQIFSKTIEELIHDIIVELGERQTTIVTDGISKENES